jgi:hypothetical protein
MQPSIPREPTDAGLDAAGSQPSGSGWRWEATGSLVCVPLFGAWLWLTNGGAGGYAQVLLAVLLGTGIGLAVSGCRRGSTDSRWAARLVLAFHLLIAALVVGYAVWVRWFNGW